MIIIDAVEMKLPPGTIILFTPEEASISMNIDSLSTHSFGIAELIKLAKALDINTVIEPAHQSCHVLNGSGKHPGLRRRL